MMRWFAIAIVCVGCSLTASYADDESGKDPGLTKILVTFADPGMSNAIRAGPAGPAYRRRSSTYLASVGVKRAANRIAEEFDLVTLDEWPIVSLKVHCLVFGVAEDMSVEELLARLKDRPEVESAQLMNEFEVTATIGAGDTDPYSNLQHNLNTLELSQAHKWSLAAAPMSRSLIPVRTFGIQSSGLRSPHITILLTTKTANFRAMRTALQWLA